MEREEALARLALRLIRMAEGVDGAIDTILARARTQVREEVAGRELAESADALARQVLSSAGMALDGDQAMPGSHDLSGLSQRLGALPVPAEEQKRFGACVRRIAGGQSTLERQTALVDLLTAVGEVLAAPERVDGGRGRGFFGRRRHDEAGAEDRARAMALVAAMLNRLLDHLDVINGAPLRNGAVRERITGMAAFDQAESLLGEIGEEMDAIDARVREERDQATDFLGTLQSRLDVFEGSVTAMAGDGQRSLERSEALRSGVGADVSSLSEAASGGGQSLEAALQGSLQRIGERLSQHVDEERAQYRAAQQRVEELTSELKKLEEESETLRLEIRNKNDLVLKDPLTGVYNRAGFEERSAELAARRQRVDSPLSLVFVDCNKFKEINDTYGHSAGDLVLRKIADVLRSRARACDIVCRYGGDEFVIILPDTAVEGAETFASSACRAVLEAGFNDNGKPLDVSISCGVTALAPGEGVDEALARADEAMYTAKKQVDRATRVHAA